MINGGQLLALIPARAGSKRLPGKNTAEICGKPLIVWSIMAALGSKYVDRVVVSTEDDKTAAIAKSAGAEVPFIRPKCLATSSTSSIAVIKHALEQLDPEGNAIEYLLLLQPTSPLRNSVHIDYAVEYFQSNHADSVIGVTEADHPLEWVIDVSENCPIESFSGLDSKLRSQDYAKKYRINGAIYLAQVPKFIKNDSFFIASNTYAYIMDEIASVDIDTKLNFMLAETLLERRLIGKI